MNNSSSDGAKAKTPQGEHSKLATPSESLERPLQAKLAAQWPEVTEVKMRYFGDSISGEETE